MRDVRLRRSHGGGQEFYVPGMVHGTEMSEPVDAVGPSIRAGIVIGLALAAIGFGVWFILAGMGVASTTPIPIPCTSHNATPPEPLPTPCPKWVNP